VLAKITGCLSPLGEEGWEIDFKYLVNNNSRKIK